MIGRRSDLISRLARGAVYSVGGVIVAGGATVAAYSSTDQGLGLRREVQFWTKLGPVVFDYWYHTASSSPLVKYQILRRQLETKTITQADTNQGFDEKDDGDDDDMDVPNDQKALYKKLHERNAPKVFEIMLELGGLYIKLGQVLSITALPIPKQYRELFRTLQSNVPGYEEFQKVIKPTLENAFGLPLEEVFESIEEIPVGAASIGQAHKAKLKLLDVDTGEQAVTDVIVKVQYPDAEWQIPADVQCVGDFLNLCVFFGVVDKSAATLSYREFSRQFLAELDYQQESQNLQEVYESSLNESAPYIRRGVLLPRVFPDLCTKKVITMTYLPGPKFEEEARKQLASLGIQNDRGIRAVLQETEEEAGIGTLEEMPKSDITTLSSSKSSLSWKVEIAERLGSVVGVDKILFLVRLSRQIFLWSTAAAVRSIRIASKLSLVSESLLQWAKEHESAQSQAEMLDWTKDAIDALFDVHGYQIFNQGLFNADAHPGNILLVQDENISTQRGRRPKLGLIDYGQCKRLTPAERERVAKLLLSVANGESDDDIASRFRELGIQTKNDSTPFLADFARLMFGPFQPQHLKHDWHRRLHQQDQVVYFPNELSMVYRASLLLRGLAMSFQQNVSVGEQWRDHAEAAINIFNKERSGSTG